MANNSPWERFALVSSDECLTIVKRDAECLSSNPKRFAEENLLGYYVLINTWLMLFQQVSAYGWKYIANYLMSQGVIPVISEFSSAADDLVNGREIESGLARLIYDDICKSVPLYGRPDIRELNINRDPIATALFVFRYPKRFSPVGASKLRDVAISSFNENQKRLKGWQRRPVNPLIYKWVREELSCMIDWNQLISECKAITLRDIVFTPGVSLDTKSSIGFKLLSLTESNIEYFMAPFGISLLSHNPDSLVKGKSKLTGDPLRSANGEDIHLVRLIVVPKNYKTGRVIAPEDVVRQGIARRMFLICDKFLPKEINLHDQGVNQKLSQYGSATGDLATLDLHAASDSVSHTLFREIFPYDFCKLMDSVLPTHYAVEVNFPYSHQSGAEPPFSIKRLQCIATMGNAMTFWIESVTFLAICKAAVKYYNLFSGDTDATVSVYGDDCIVPTDSAPTVIEWLEKLGFVVNTDKSFYSRSLLYRESCGEEYLNGVCVSSRYFPRFPIRGKLGQQLSRSIIRDTFTGTEVDSMTALIDLQHKMFQTCVPAAVFLSEVIKASEPRMTSSTPDMGLSDIWDYVPNPHKRKLPMMEIMHVTFTPEVGNTSYELEWSVKPDNPVEVDTYLAPYVRYEVATPDSRAERELWKRVLDVYNYQTFLQYGPRYAGKLEEIIRVSEPPLSFDQAFGEPNISWKFSG